MKDDVKFELSELNNQKELVINGPASQLFKRAIHMSYLQGQKFAIDEIFTLIDENQIDEEFLIQYNNFFMFTYHVNLMILWHLLLFKGTKFYCHTYKFDNRITIKNKDFGSLI